MACCFELIHNFCRNCFQVFLIEGELKKLMPAKRGFDFVSSTQLVASGLPAAELLLAVQGNVTNSASSWLLACAVRASVVSIYFLIRYATCFRHCLTCTRMTT
eukprot:scaffold50240_cov38-Prasinocladus_malaysianus.AAC.1